MPRMAKKKQNTHKYRVLSLRPADVIREAIEELARAEQRSVSQMTLILVKEALEARKRLPPRGCQ